MGEYEVWVEPSGILPNGLLPNTSTSVTRVLDADQWLKAEEKTAELIACIQPNQPSEERRNAVADYVQRLIMKCFPCQVFTFGSVPLKTYLPDGDIDVSAFSKNQTLQETWASQVRDLLESEERNENAEFHVKEVQYIQAEVKIVKCLVENIVVDISFNQLGGLCTLCFLEEIDNLISQNHLFKRSIILIKAWCYYESRILGAHHGLISTYALETLVLYIFHVFNNTFAGPLEVLYRFLEFFSNFDWDNYCVSLWGPVPISSLPDVTAKPPRKDSGELLLSKLFLDACSSVYAVFPNDQENQGQGTCFVAKHFNVIDALRVNNNLGRSVSKGNFFRIRSAFAFGAKRLARLIDCPEEDIAFELNQFFMNTRERHGSGNRPDAPSSLLQGLDDHKYTSSIKKMNDYTEGAQSSPILSSRRVSHPQENTSEIIDVSAASPAQNQKNYGSMINSRVSVKPEKSNSNQAVPIDHRIPKLDHMMKEVHGKHLFARTRSSPELKDTYSDPPESGKIQASSSRAENRRKNVISENVAQGGMAVDTPPPQTLDVSLDSNSGSNGYFVDSGISTVAEEQHVPVIRVQAVHQEEQDRVNTMASSVHTFGGQVPLPLNFASAQFPVPISPSLMASIGYAQRNLAGIVPANMPLIYPSWASNMQFPHGMIPSPPPLGQFYPANENFGSVEMTSAEADSDFWHERGGVGSNGVLFGLDDANMEMSTDDQQPSTSGSSNHVPASRFGGSGSALKKFTKDNREFVREEYQEACSDDIINRPGSGRSSTASQAGSMRSRASSEGSWDGGSSTKVSKTTREKRGRKFTASPSSSSSSSVYGKEISISDHGTAEADDENGDWSRVSTQSTASLHVPGHQSTGFESTQTSASDSLIPFTPILLGPGSQQRMMDSNSGSVPFAFYPTGPLVPFVTMLPVYNFRSDASNHDESSTHLVVEDNNDPGQTSEPPEMPREAEVLSTSSSMIRASPAEKPSGEHKPDILNSDFASHWQNLQYGRFCQNPRFHGPVIYQSPVVVPPMYLQGRFPWDGPGRPFAATNTNMFSQMMSYGPRLVPVAPVPSVSNRTRSIYQQYADELPRYRSGTGTYLPNPKASARERHSSGTRRTNNNYDRGERHHGTTDREGIWTGNPKSRASGRNHNRSQADKSSFHNRLAAANESRVERRWGSYRNELIPSFQAQNSSQAYGGVYPMPGMNQSGVSSNGTAVPSVVMLYPYEHDPGEQLEFGSLGPVERGIEISVQLSSQDQPSSSSFLPR